MAVDYVPYTGPIVTRAEAKASGAGRYFTGKLCPQGHTTWRYTSSAKCMECIRLRDQGRKRDPETERIRHRATHEARMRNEEYRERFNKRRAEQNRQYRSANPEKHRAKARAYQNSFAREDRLARNKAWLAANPLRARMYTQRRRARKLKAEGFYVPDDIDRIRKAQRDRCALCRIRLKQKGYVDHIIALVKGGSNWPRNLQLLCLSCNSRKHARDQLDFVRERGFLI